MAVGNYIWWKMFMRHVLLGDLRALLFLLSNLLNFSVCRLVWGFLYAHTIGISINDNLWWIKLIDGNHFEIVKKLFWVQLEIQIEKILRKYLNIYIDQNFFPYLSDSIEANSCFTRWITNFEIIRNVNHFTRRKFIEVLLSLSKVKSYIEQ